MSNLHSYPVLLHLPAKSRLFAIMMVILICSITGPFALSKDQYGIPESPKKSTITDGELLGWVGKWQGHCHVGADSMPVEIRWKLTDDGIWMRGDFKIWSDFKKVALIHNEIIYIRPDSTPGEYKGIGFGEDGTCRMGRAEIKDRVWDWTWTYDNGSQEKGKLVFYAQGEITYDAAVADANGLGVKTLNYDITRPVTSYQSKY